MSNVKISANYIDNALFPISKSGKIVPSILMFKNPEIDDEVVINTCDKDGTCWLGIRTKTDNISFDAENLGILDLGNFVKYITLVDYPDTETSTVNRVEARTRRGSRHDCLEIEGAIGKFTMPVAQEESFESKNKRVQKERNETIDNDSVEKIASFKLSRSELKSLTDIGKGLDISKVTISVCHDSIKLFLKGSGNNQYTRTLDDDSYRLESMEFEDGTTGTFPDDGDYEEYLPFMHQIFDLAYVLDADFVFEIRRNSGVYSLQAYGSKSDEDHSDIRYVMITAFSPANVLSGNNEIDVFEFNS